MTDEWVEQMQEGNAHLLGQGLEVGGSIVCSVRMDEFSQNLSAIQYVRKTATSAYSNKDHKTAAYS